MTMRLPKGGIRNEMREKAMREEIIAQLGALCADAGVEQVACKDESVGDYLAGKTDALAVAMLMMQAKALPEIMSRFLRDETTRNANLAESARLCSKDMMARIYEGKAAGYMAAQRVVTEIREMNEHE